MRAPRQTPKAFPLAAITLMLGFAFSAAALGQTTYSTHMFVNGTEGAPIAAGEPAVLELQYRTHNEEQGTQVVKDMKRVMGKIMHLVVIKKDLSEFAHFHPTYDMGHGLFQAPIHMPMKNPDNKDAAIAFPTEGDYLVYAEAISEQYGMLMRGFDYQTSGKPTESDLVVDTPSKDGIYSVYTDENNSIDSFGAKYRTDIRFETISGDGGDLIHVYLTLNERVGKTYEEVETLKPWLMMGGHAIVISEAGDTARDKTFAHFHADLPATGGSLKFTHFARTGMNPGVYKVWFQFRHDDLILKVPLVFDYSAEPTE